MLHFKYRKQHERLAANIKILPLIEKDYKIKLSTTLSQTHVCKTGNGRGSPFTTTSQQ